MILEYGGCSHRGMVRKSNEDYYYIPHGGQTQSLAIIADGMGGHNAGEIASSMAVDIILEYIAGQGEQKDRPHYPIAQIKKSIELSNHMLFTMAESDEDYKGMGTTLVLAYFHEGRVYLGHVGDSRGYLIRKGQISQVTKDHSLVQELLDNGSITSEEVEKHPQKNIITRALGTEETIEIDCHEITLQAGDIVLLCTDGLILHVDLEQEIGLLESSNSMQELAHSLVELALEDGGLDNVSVVAIKYSGMVKEG